MERQSLQKLQKTIQDHTRRKTIDQLKAEGKRHVRVVSGQKVMQLIQAVVNDIVDDEVHELNAQDRERITKEAQRKFDRVLSLQQEQDQRIRELREKTRESEREADELRAERALLQRRLESATAQRDDSRVTGELTKLRASLHALGEQQSAELTRTASSLEERLRRLSKELPRTALTELETRLTELETELTRTLERVETETTAVRERLDRRLGSGPDLSVLNELGEVRDGLEAELRRLRADQQEALGRLSGDLSDGHVVETRELTQRLEQRLDEFGEQLRTITKSSAAAQETLAGVVETGTAATADELARTTERMEAAVAALTTHLAEREETHATASAEELASLRARLEEQDEIRTALLSKIEAAVALQSAAQPEATTKLREDLLALREDTSGLAAALEKLRSSSDDVQAWTLGIEELRTSLETLREQDATVVEHLADLGRQAEAEAERSAELVAQLETLATRNAAALDAVEGLSVAESERHAALPELIEAAIERRTGPLREDLSELTDSVATVSLGLAQLAETSRTGQEALVTALVETRDELNERADARIAELREAVVELDSHVDRSQQAVVDAVTASGAEAERRLEEFGLTLEERSARSAEHVAGIQSTIVDAIAETRTHTDTALTAVRGSLDELEQRVGERLDTSLDELRGSWAEYAGVRREADEGLRHELDELRAAVVRLEERGANDRKDLLAGVRELLERRDADQQDALDARFEAALDRALDKIDRTLEAHTAKPVEVSVEATSVLLDKIFDAGGEELSTNLGRLDVEASSSRAGIGNSVARLRALRGRKQAAEA